MSITINSSLQTPYPFLRVKNLVLSQDKKDELGISRLLGYLNIDKPIVFYDLETTGLEGNKCRLVEISLVKLYPKGNVEIITQRINPEIPIPTESTKVHGIKDEDVKNCPTFLDIAHDLENFISDSHLGNYNIINFDFPVFQKEFNRAGIKFDLEGRAVIDPVRIYHRFMPAKEGEQGNRRLINAYKYYCNKDLTKAHTANGDVLATIEVLIGQYQVHRSLIPRDVYALSEMCQEKLPDYVDSRGKLIWRKNKEDNWEVVCNYMKPEHRGKTLKEVIKTDMEYIRWVLEPKEFDYSDEVKSILMNAMNEIYPER